MEMLTSVYNVPANMPPALLSYNAIDFCEDPKVLQLHFLK